MKRKHQTKLSLLLKFLLLFGFNEVHGDAFWEGTTNTELSQPNNWLNSSLPNSATLANFGPSNTSGYHLTASSGDLTTSGIVFLNTNAQAYNLTANAQAISIGSNGVINDSSATQTLSTNNGGSITIAALTSGGVTSTGNNVNYTLSGSGDNLTFFGATHGNGYFTMGSGNTFTVGGDATIGSLNSASANTVLDGSLTITSISNHPTLGNISGIGAVIISPSSPAPFDYMNMSGTNTYSGGTLINAGVVIVSSALPVNGNVEINGQSIVSLYQSPSQVIGNLSGNGGAINWTGTTADFTINQSSTNTFSGIFICDNTSSNLILGAPLSAEYIGNLILTGNSSSFDGNVIVNSGNLQVNGDLAANSFLVNAGGTLSGTGTFGTTEKISTINSAGTIAPGNSPGMLTNLGNQIMNEGSFFSLYENGLTSGSISQVALSLLQVNGTTTVGIGGAAIVNLFPMNNLINLNTKQAFIKSTNALTVETPFSLNYISALAQANFNLETVGIPTLSYNENNYYIQTQTTFENAVIADGGTKEAIALASLFDAIVDPITSTNLLLNTLAKLTIHELMDVLTDISGRQYATRFFGAEISNRRFLRRLYDPIRHLIITEINPCAVVSRNPRRNEFLGGHLWGSYGKGQTHIQGKYGAKSKEWDVTLGLQKTAYQNLTLGMAGSYEKNKLNDHHSNGSEDEHTLLGGVYGLYRPPFWYVIANAIYGHTEQNSHRHVVINESVYHFNASPTISQATFYAEMGVDWNLYSFFAQPFIGIEIAKSRQNRFTETDIDLSGLGLTINKKARIHTVGSLGIHFTDQFCAGFNLSIDLAWLYRFNNNHHFDVSLASINSNKKLTVDGRNTGRNSGEGAITLSQELPNCKIFIEASGEIWNKASTYNLLSGIQLVW